MKKELIYNRLAKIVSQCSREEYQHKTRLTIRTPFGNDCLELRMHISVILQLHLLRPLNGDVQLLYRKKFAFETMEKRLHLWKASFFKKPQRQRIVRNSCHLWNDGSGRLERSNPCQQRFISGCIVRRKRSCEQLQTAPIIRALNS